MNDAPIRPQPGRHEVTCDTCGKIFSEIIHYGGEDILERCEYCEQSPVDCYECYKIKENKI